MALEMKVPSPGESITEVEIAEWLVADGDWVEKDQAIAEVDSDKATLELPAEASGIISLKAEEGDAVAVGAVVCFIDTKAKRPDGKPVPQKMSNSSENKSELVVEQAATLHKESYATGSASPAAKKILAEKNMDTSTLKGTGKDGRITKDDAVKAVPSMGTIGGGKRGTSRKKLSMLRRKVAERLVSVKNDTAMLTTFNEVDMSPIFELRKKYKEEFKEKHSVGLGFMSFFTLAVVRALELFPDVNSMIDGDFQIKHDFKDISIAVSGPKGLMVPVIRNAENLSFRGVESEVKRLAILARDGQIIQLAKLNVDELLKEDPDITATNNKTTRLELIR
ncbi:MAG: dihydrolipoyllysine-residue succinyltransferase, partial [Flavobacteriaceae bacterium]|nr:dihydrolipoyllysine-residue succinyltransferase [Flavobacteriaceae bacterium]